MKKVESFLARPLLRCWLFYTSTHIKLPYNFFSESSAEQSSISDTQVKLLFWGNETTRAAASRLCRLCLCLRISDIEEEEEEEEEDFLTTFGSSSSS